MVARVVIGVVAILIGIVWFFQGIGTLKGSFMTGEAIWAVIGVLAVLVGAALLLGAQRSRRS
jgi:hypothetical protein